MKIKNAFAAAALLLAGIGMSPAVAQSHGMHNGGPGMGGHGHGMNHGRDMHRGGRGHGWNHQRCRTVWKHHHRVKRCW